MPKKTYIAEVRDPVTDELIKVEADTEEELDRLLDERFDISAAETQNP